MKRLVFVGVVLLSVVLLGSVLFTARADGSVEVLNSSSTVFSSGFETGDYSEWTTSWTEGGGKIGIVSDVSHHGSYSSRANFTAAWQGAWAEIDGLSANPVFIRWYVRFDTLPGNAESFSMAEAVDSSDVTIWDIDIWRNGLGATGIWLYRSRPINTDHYVSYNFEVDKWYCIEVKFYLHASSGEFRVYVNGAEILTVTDVDTSGNAWAGVKLGRGSGFVSSVEVWTDCVQIADTYIGPESADLVVRGTDGYIYYKSYSGSTWNDWASIPGETPFSPASAVFQGELHIARVGPMYNAIYWGTVDLTTGEFSGWTWIPGATDSAPVLASSSSKLYLVVRGTDSLIYYKSYDGSTWSDWTLIPAITPHTPAATVLQGKLHIAHVGPMYNAIYWGSIDLTTGEFSGWTWIPGASDSAPALASSSDKLYVVVRGTDGIIYYKSYDGSTWSDWTLIPAITPYAPAASVFEGKLNIAHVGPTFNDIYTGSVDVATDEFSGWTWIPGATDSAPTLAW